MDVHIQHHAHEQAIRELAANRGLSFSDAIGVAVCNELERDRETERRTEYLARVREAQAIFAAAPILDPRTPDEIIGFDEHGLPT
ncbi:type II toxin-antitoxin system VapB family antitoxin [Sphingomonas sp. CD22]|uniref:type II toxin-antitoxin system VapB family antitoxin n=1 Tax=Sphingomonas sp. CD22 TaxID=3100214 RepID=UPI002AE056E2|nr:type II toxin-antitoxin system VapB family antitoxin [Sphingomonas sp. CD22]MEA1085975.1 type II toxin-antitoxin system VapB family antitoxin [Sphingomonas sp. CD22]